MTAEARKVVIVGAGPAGMALAYLLARRGVGVVVLESHPDFARAFRGDTVHPSTLEAIDALRILTGTPALRWILPTIIGWGVRPARVKTVAEAHGKEASR